jgi:hypothetical protein
VVTQLNNVAADERIGTDRTLVVPRMANTSAAWADTFVALLLTGIKPDPGADSAEPGTKVSQR